MEISGIIKSDIINPGSDAFWSAIDELVAGKGQRETLILTAPVEKGSAEETRLDKMIEACKLPADSYNLISLDGAKKAAWHQLKEKLAPKKIFLIGVLPSQLGISALFRLNEPNNFDGCIWLPTLSLNELGQHIEARKQLMANGITPLFIDKIYK